MLRETAPYQKLRPPGKTASSHSRFFSQQGCFKCCRRRLTLCIVSSARFRESPISCATRCGVEDALRTLLAPRWGDAGCRHGDLRLAESHLLANHPDANALDHALCVS